LNIVLHSGFARQQHLEYILFIILLDAGVQQFAQVVTLLRHLWGFLRFWNLRFLNWDWCVDIGIGSRHLRKVKTCLLGELLKVSIKDSRSIVRWDFPGL